MHTRFRTSGLIWARALTALALVLSGAACTSSTDPSNSALIVYGAGGSGAGAARYGVPMASDLGPEWEHGAAGSLVIKLYALYISPNADCSAPVLVQQLAANGEDRDFMLNPVLFEGSPAEGNYPCVMFKMSDVLRMKPATSFGSCVAGTQYSGDIYRAGEDDWKDAFLNPIIGTGSDEAPSDDRVTIFMTRNPEAAMARGISPHQIVPLLSSLIVPGQSTLNLNASQSVVTNGVECGLEPPAISFQ